MMPKSLSTTRSAKSVTKAARADRRWVLILLGLTVVAGLVALLTKQWCRINGWAAPEAHLNMCYSDFGQLFGTRGLAEGYFPFFTPLPEGQWMEYPALLAVVAGVTAWLVPGEGASHERTVMFFDINAAGILLCWLIVVVATAYTARGHSKDALLVAIAPGIILTAYLNWDLWAVMLAALALWAWAAGRPVLTGVLLGLGAAMKLYPLFFFGAILVLCLRAGRLSVFFKSLAAGVGAWLAVNVPFMLTAFDQWSRFYTFSGDREVSFSSLWLAFTWTGLDGSTFSLISNGLFALCCAGIAWLCWAAPQRPRMAQLCFLVVAAFILLGKVYSPQFVMWLIPLVVLARPNWKQFWVWQIAEVYHWAGVWMESARITSGGVFGDGAVWIPLWYGSGIVLHMAAVIWLCISVIRDIWHPERDVVRHRAVASGQAGSVHELAADPQAGVLVTSPDRFLMSPASRSPEHPH